MSAYVELLILVAIAAFLLYRLRGVLGTKTGHNNPSDYVRDDTAEVESSDNVVTLPGARAPKSAEAELDAVVGHSDPHRDALAAMIAVEEGFSPKTFLEGAKGAYEMILMAFENGDTDLLRQFLADDVYESFASVIEDRRDEGLTVDAKFIGIREATIDDARFDESDRMGEVTIKFVGEMITVVRNADHEVVEGDPTEVRRTSDIWTFGREMGASDPNWLLIATDG